jgi:hypothetical protein
MDSDTVLVKSEKSIISNTPRLQFKFAAGSDRKGLFYAKNDFEYGTHADVNLRTDVRTSGDAKSQISHRPASANDHLAGEEIWFECRLSIEAV